jgi:hypothetical protein
MEQHDMADKLYVTLLFLFLVGVGAVLMFLPRRIQRLAAMDRWGPFTGPTLGTKFMRKYIESPLYLWQLRFGGALALVFAAVLLYIVVFR